MFIRTQDKEALVNVDNIAVIDIINGDDEKGAEIVAADNIQHASNRTNLVLGSYGSRQTALNILNSIASCVESEYSTNINGDYYNDSYNNSINLGVSGCKNYTVFEMP